MRAVIQRVKSAQVQVAEQTVGKIEHGILVLLGLSADDDLLKGQKLIDKILKYRIFADQEGKMSLNVQQVHGGILLVSQFTLVANTHKGLRPDFGSAMPPAHARALYEEILAYCQTQYAHVASGQFAADMQVHLINDGPVTFNLEM